MGSAPPWAGVTPAPSEGKREDAGCALLEQVKGRQVALFLCHSRALLDNSTSTSRSPERSRRGRIPDPTSPVIFTGRVTGTRPPTARRSVGEGSASSSQKCASVFCVILERSEESRRTLWRPVLVMLNALRTDVSFRAQR
jgi:hypothetical protein